LARERAGDIGDEAEGKDKGKRARRLDVEGCAKRSKEEYRDGSIDEHDEKNEMLDWTGLHVLRFMSCQVAYDILGFGEISETRRQQEDICSQHPRGKVKNREGRCCSPRHRNDLQIANPQADIEAPPAFTLPNTSNSLPPTHPIPSLERAPNLHPSPNNLKRIACRLGSHASDSAAEEVEGGAVVGVELGGEGGAETAIGEEGNAGVGDHAEEGDGEAAVKGGEGEGLEERWGF
jgi:hypothetical protein